jgi:hypothetical protein
VTLTGERNKQITITHVAAVEGDAANIRVGMYLARE